MQHYEIEAIFGDVIIGQKFVHVNPETKERVICTKRNDWSADIDGDNTSAHWNHGAFVFVEGQRHDSDGPAYDNRHGIDSYC